MTLTHTSEAVWYQSWRYLGASLLLGLFSAGPVSRVRVVSDIITRFCSGKFQLKHLYYRCGLEGGAYHRL